MLPDPLVIAQTKIKDSQDGETNEQTDNPGSSSPDRETGS